MSSTCATKTHSFVHSFIHSFIDFRRTSDALIWHYQSLFRSNRVEVGHLCIYLLQTMMRRFFSMCIPYSDSVCESYEITIKVSRQTHLESALITSNSNYVLRNMDPEILGTILFYAANSKGKKLLERSRDSFHCKYGIFITITPLWCASFLLIHNKYWVQPINRLNWTKKELSTPPVLLKLRISIINMVW